MSHRKRLSCKMVMRQGGQKLVMLPKPAQTLYGRYVCEHLVNILSEKLFFSTVQTRYQKGKSAEEHLFPLAN